MTQRTTSPPNEYTTAKLSLAGFLIASGICQLVRAFTDQDGKSVVFVLTPTPTEDQIASYFNGVGEVSALAFNNATGNLKSVVYEAKRSR